MTQRVCLLLLAPWLRSIDCHGTSRRAHSAEYAYAIIDYVGAVHNVTRADVMIMRIIINGSR